MPLEKLQITFTFDLWGRIDSELELGLLAVLHGEPVHEERGKPRARSSAEGVVHREALPRNECQISRRSMKDLMMSIMFLFILYMFRREFVHSPVFPCARLF